VFDTAVKVSLVRTEYGQAETVGVLIVDGLQRFATLEPPWRANSPGISCIPEGVYTCTRSISAHHGPVFWVLDVPHRADIILGHIGNTHRDTEGCVLFGMYPGRLDYTRAVMSSQRAVATWQAITSGVDKLELQILGVRL